ncbi:MAG: DNA/RNA nuclease SfsA [Clostridia bacterium]|nr:DNA/RNA nuclease SfsA [Clostridia bacterium]
MRYSHIVRGVFVDRPNRFIANVEVAGEVSVCHVKNTGRCRELLIKGVTVVLEASKNPLRKTKYDLVAVYKGDKLINIDSQAPNAVFGEWARTSGFFGEAPTVRAEQTYGSSRFDYYVEHDGRRAYVEVKGVTLEQDGVVMFPDAPTERGVKHINELIKAKKDGFDAYLFFVVQMEECRYFTPNRVTHRALADALCEARREGVDIRAYCCNVSEDGMTIKDPVDVVL